MSTKNVKAGLSKANVNAIAGAIGTATLNRLVPIFSTSVAYEKGQYTNYNNQLYRFTANKAAGAWDSTKVESASLNDLIHDVNEAVATINNKANVDGNYPTLTSGLSDNLNTKIVQNNLEAYLFRTAGGSLEIGNNCKVKSITGGTIFWNQKTAIKQATGFGGITVTHTEDGWTIYNGTITSIADGGRDYGSNITGVKNHIMLCIMEAKGDSTSQESGIPKVQDGYVGTVNCSLNTVGGKKARIVKSEGNAMIPCYYLGAIGDTLTNFAVRVQYFDLTAMFGSTIANYIYSLEQATAGAGVAWFKKYFPKEYYAYSAPTPLHVKTNGKKIVGFNQLDLSDTDTHTTHCDYNNGLVSNKTSYVDSKTSFAPKVQIYKGSTYVESLARDYQQVDDKYLILFNSSIANSQEGYKILIAHNGSVQDLNLFYLIDVLPNTEYCVSFKLVSNNPSVAAGLKLDEVNVNFHYDGERDGEFEEFESETYACDAVELKGIPLIDTSGNLYFDGDAYNNDGSIDEEYIVIDLASLTWSHQNAGTVGYWASSHLPVDAEVVDNYTKVKGFSSNYQTMKGGYQVGNTEDYIGNIGITTGMSVNVNNGSTTNSPTGYLIYKRKDVVQSNNATPFPELQKAYNWGTEEYIDAHTGDVAMPVGHDTDYPLDLKSKLEIMPDLPSNDGDYICQVSSGTAEYVALGAWLSTNGYIKLTDITGYDAEKTQTLKNVEGTLTWVDD